MRMAGVGRKFNPHRMACIHNIAYLARYDCDDPDCIELATKYAACCEPGACGGMNDTDSDPTAQSTAKPWSAKQQTAKPIASETTKTWTSAKTQYSGEKGAWVWAQR